MEMVHCPNCSKMTGHKRALGWGTFFAVLITAGLWIFIIPFYPKRCIICGEGKEMFAQAGWLHGSGESKTWYQTLLGIPLIILAILFMVNLFKHVGAHNNAQGEGDPPRPPSVLRMLEDSTTGERPLPAGGDIERSQSPQRGDEVLPSSHDQSASIRDTGTDRFVDSSIPGYTSYTNGRFGFRIDYPKYLIAQKPPDNGDGIKLFSPDGRAELIAAGGNNDGQILKNYYDFFLQRYPEVKYRAIGDDWFILSKEVNGRIKYIKMFVGSQSHNLFTFSYPSNQKNEMDKVVVSVEKSFIHGDINQAW